MNLMIRSYKRETADYYIALIAYNGSSVHVLMVNDTRSVSIVLLYFSAEINGRKCTRCVLKMGFVYGSKKNVSPLLEIIFVSVR